MSKEINGGLNKKLTETEKDVLKSVLEGLNDREIANKFHISHHTAKAHLNSILGKFGAKNNTALLRIILEKNFDQ